MNKSIISNHTVAIDYIKAIGIVFVVIGHYPVSIFNVFIPYAFHMPLFFFLGGILFNDKKKLTATIKKVFTHHFLYIAITFIIIGVITNSLGHLLNLETNDIFNINPIQMFKDAIKSNLHNNRFFLVAWFLFIYGTVAILFKITFNLTHTKKLNQPLILLIIGITCGFIGIDFIASKYESTKLFYLNNISEILVGFMYFAIGFYTRQFIWLTLHPYAVIVFFLINYTLFQNNISHQMIMSWSSYPDGLLMHLFTSLSCIYSVFFFAEALASYGKYSLISYIGQISKTIMSYHLLIFLLIDIVFYKLGLFELKGLSTEKYSLFVSSYSWAIYVSLGIALPTTCKYIFDAILKKTTSIKFMFSKNDHTHL
ncbi:acyltransferase family protein [Kosakonia sacchari]